MPIPAPTRRTVGVQSIVSLTRSFVEDGEQLFGICIWTIAIHPESDERTDPYVQPEAPAHSRMIEYHKVSKCAPQTDSSGGTDAIYKALH